MEEKNDIDKLDDVVMPGFRFHPTDEELVGFYLKRKIQQRPLPIELIKQVDIYKYDPWDLPKELSTTGEKEWYFYCPRDRKYKNSERPNRVTGAGFWKATGTDRPIYFSHGTKCIGLKKSLVFYRGRAAKGIKTDWMMHEFRLPSLTDSSPQKKLLDKTIPPNDAWAICRIFKKTNSMSQRALSHSWVSPLPQTAASDILSQGEHSTQFSSENVSSTTEIASVIQSCGNTDLQQASTTSFSAFHIPSYKPLNPTFYKPPLLPISTGDLPNNNMFSSPEISGPNKCTNDVPSMFLNTSLFGDIIKGSENNIGYDGPQQQLRGFSISMHQDTQGNITMQEDETAGSKKNPNATHDNNWGTIQSIGFPLSLPLSMPDAWKPNVPWDSPPCPSEMSTTYSPNNCYT